MATTVIRGLKHIISEESRGNRLAESGKEAAKGKLTVAYSYLNSCKMTEPNSFQQRKITLQTSVWYIESGH